MSLEAEKQGIVREIKTQITILVGLVAFAWALELLDIFVFNHQLDRFGIYPRAVIGLRGIVFAPFLHGGVFHLIANTIPFVVLGWLIMLRETTDFFIVSAVSALVGGFGTWLLGRPSFHIGASGVIFGFLGYLLARGWFDRKPLSIALSLFVGITYGSMIWGVLPLNRWVSWEGHLFGFLGGVLAARLISDRRAKIH
ncbi:MAG TPA: rhomboid family intramembrane serine protease [Leptolyngbyaceae cyanobacterium M33_DOE_097]|uniref:Rhomboid family intramembrane serine protease n=1 Tax=Oscillatoriales cyanobacterium SpSt-418 TaxID=2282169 RepID=A0A7C3PF31_9CYAN|nr:rhomboid family intramembrane serine protease [Leptolyngbyaceae cyanobacterium M33_DOE_097]